LNLIKWTGIIFFPTFIFIIYLISEITYPGPDASFEVLFEWFDNTNRKIILTTFIIWSTLGFFCTFTTFYSILQLKKVVKIISESVPNIKFNFGALIFHFSILVLWLVLGISYCIVYWFEVADLPFVILLHTVETVV